MKMKEHYDTVSGANSDKYLVNEGAIKKESGKPNIPDAVKRAASNYTVKAPSPKK